MNKATYCIGLMSGTSLDGVDIVYVKLNKNELYEYKIIHCQTYSYSSEWLSLLKGAFHKDPSELIDLDKNYGSYLGELVNVFIKDYKIESVDFIASHGHTIFHKPEEGYTLQIGSGVELCNTTGYKVVCDFRSQDVALGGQGAPLVPIGDALLFDTYDYCLNLGGFVNVSYCENDSRKAFDICPVNIVMNYYMEQVGKSYDENGGLASTGTVDKELLNRLNSDPFYALPHPKSLGFEFVKQNVLPMIDNFGLELKDLLCTFVEHVAMQIAKVVKEKPNATVLITGGGAYNDFLLERIQVLSESKLVIPSNKLVEFKEALIFSLLGLLKINNEINCLKSVTGASKDHSSGVVVELL